MVHSFKIPFGTEKEIVKETLKRVLPATVVMVLFFVSLFVIKAVKLHRMSTGDQINMASTVMVPGLLYYYFARYLTLFYKLETISITDSGVEQKFDVDGQLLSQGERFLLWINKKAFRDKFLRWDEILKVEDTGNSLLLMNKDGLKKKLEGIITIPKKIKNYEAAAELIKKHAKV